MCILSIKVPIRKTSANLFNDPRTSTAPPQRDQTLPHNKCPGYDTKLHEMVRLWYRRIEEYGVPLLPGVLWIWLVVSTMAQIELFNHLLRFIIIIVTSLEFFTSALADGLSLEFEWQQVSSSLQDSSQYSGRPQQCCSLDGLHSSSNTPLRVF